jgi:cytochrome P450
VEPSRSLGVDEIDLSAAEFWGLPRDVRDGAFATLRAARPVAHFPDPVFEQVPSDGRGFWALTRHAHVLEASRHPEVFSSARGSTSIMDLPEPFPQFFGSMINMDDPEHARLRHIVSRSFTPRMLSRFAADVERAADEILDEVAERGSCDFVTDVAARLPLRVICDMMGIPASQYGFVLERSNVILSAGDPELIGEGTDPVMAILTAGAELAQLVGDLGALRRAEPREDLISALVNATIDGDHLSDAELGSFFILLAVAGNETTRNALSHGLVALTDHPDQRRRWQEDFEALAPSAVEEIVRWASPVIFMRRSLLAPWRFDDVELEAGERVLLLYASANRDEMVFDDPWRFDLSRSPNPHVGFGGPGPHFCLGAHLARREITILFRRLFRRLGDIEAVGEPSYLDSDFINGIKHLPAAFTPAARVTRSA